MSQTRLKSTFITLFFGLAPVPVLAQVGSSVPNWTVPPYRASSAGGGLSTMTDISPGVGFVAMEPCRVFDTRNAVGHYGGPRLLANTIRNFDIDGGPPTFPERTCPGIPAGVEAYSMNFGAILPDGANSFITIWPTGSARPNVSSINPIQGVVVANAAIVPAGTDGQISVFPNTGVHLYGDINGYFTDEYNLNNPFVVTGIFGLAQAAAIVGINQALAIGSGVFGQGGEFGVVGRISSNNLDRAGVIGQTGFVNPDAGYYAAGVRGEGQTGVLGVSGHFLGGGDGVAGSLVNGFGAEITYGALGTSFGADPGSGIAPWGVFSGSTIGAVGTKHFLEPHPSDPKLVISYISLEGPEAGTYFRGRAKFQNGMARISVPEHFRFVTDPEGLTVQITGFGEMATFAVLRLDLNEIVVKASRNVEFSYLVQGVRATYKDAVPVQRTDVFMPRSATSKLPQGLSPAQQRLLIQNGTYREDGSVNVETARRLGWDKIWEQRSRPSPQQTEP